MSPARTFVIFDGCVAPTLLVPRFELLQQRTGCHFNSVYRGDEATGLLHKLGKHSQRELFDGFDRRLPGFLPANRPGTSTHELKSDGVAYPDVPVGGDLVWWRCGFDVNDDETDAVIGAGRAAGWTIWRPYPSGSEIHHLNFKALPVMPAAVGTYAQWSKWYRAGRKGDRPNVPETIPDAWWKRLRAEERAS